jgi:predicted ATP-grasp superfamily ATP-dependent carboligase
MQTERYDKPALVCDAGMLSQVAIIQELGRLGIPVVAIADSPQAIGFSSRYVSQRIICSTPSHDPEYIRFLISSSPRGVIFYSNDANTENIARNRMELAANGFSLLVSPASTLERVIEKDRLFQTASECGVSVPKCRRVYSVPELQECAAEFGVPLILKSTNLAGGIYRFVQSRGAAPAVFREMFELINSEAYRHRGAHLMAQQWIPQSGARLWNFNACVKSGEILCHAMGERIRTDVLPDGWRGSMLLFGRTAHNDRILEQNRRLLRHLAFDGIVETEWSEGSPEPGSMYLYDFNPRFSGNIRWTFRSGVSLAGQYYRLALGMPPQSQTMRDGTLYAKVFFHRNDFIDAIDNPGLSFLQKLAVLKDDLTVITRCRRHAADILDPSDLGPTLHAAAELASSLSARLRRFTHNRTRSWRLRLRHQI